MAYKMNPEEILEIINQNPDKYKRQLDRLLAADSLVDYISIMWNVLEPSVEFSRGWHIDCICEHLTAVSNGEINRLLLNVPPGSSKPVWEEEDVLTINGVKKLKDIVVGDLVMTHKGRFRRVEAVHIQGDLPTLTINTHNGRKLTTALDHPILTTRGWVQAKDIKTYDSVAVVHQQEDIKPIISNEEARFLGYLVGDGSTSHKNCIKFTNNNIDNINDFEYCCKKLGFYTRKSIKYKNSSVYDISVKASEKPWQTKKMGKNPLHYLLEHHKLLGKNSYTKRIPEDVINSSFEVIENFIAAYWSCDGCIRKRTDSNKTSFNCFCSSVSKSLITDVVNVLSRLGIDCRIREKHINRKSIKQSGDIYVSYEAVTSDQDNVAKFKRFPICKEKLDWTEDAVRISFDTLYYADKVESIEESGFRKCRCLTVDEDCSFTANGIAVHNSLLTSVFFPSWEWGPRGKPYNQFLTFSYSQRLAERDNVKCRTLIRSHEYQALWGDVFKLVKDTNSKKKFANDKNGFKEVSSVGGTGTGLRGDRVVIDDPHSVKQGDSATEMKTGITWFNETLPTRLNPHETSSIIVIMQRIAENDVSGEILSKELGYEHVMIPMEFEPERRCYTVVLPGGYKAKDGRLYFWDKRSEDGELMWKEKYPKSRVDEMKKQLGNYGTAGQLQQRPAPREGALFKLDKIKKIKMSDLPKDGFYVRGWDLAGSTSNDSPYTAGAKMYFDNKNNFYLVDMVRFKAEERNVVQTMKNTAEGDGKDCIIDFPQDPGQAGKGQAVYIKEQLAGYVVKSSLESGSKVLRATALADQNDIGHFYIVEASWNKDFLDEIGLFPGSRFKDQVDACSRAFHQGLAIRDSLQDENIAAPVVVM